MNIQCFQAHCFQAPNRFLGNEVKVSCIPREVTKKQIVDTFQEFGQLQKILFPDKFTNNETKSAVLRFKEAAAVKATLAMHGKSHWGSILNVIEVKPV